MSVRRSSAVVVAALVGGVLVAGGVASAAPSSSPPVEKSVDFKLGCDGYEHLAVDISDVFHSTGVTVVGAGEGSGRVDLHVPGATECDVSADRWPCGSQCR